jgi:rod shape determining protein RodA
LKGEEPEIFMLSLFLPALIIIACGLAILSALSFHFFVLQLVWVVVGVLVVAAFWFFDWRALFSARWVVWGVYIGALLLMLAAYLHGPVIRNTRSWLVLGPITLQPVEFMKVALILLYAYYFSRRHLAVARWRYIFTSFFFFVIPAAIAVRLPDVGSAVIFAGIWFGFLLVSGLPLKRIAVAAVVFALAAGFIWFYVLKDYHRARIAGFFSPQTNALGINYSLVQSKIAIGSAGFFGKGYGQGTQAELGFLSEPTEDFIFAAFVEEWGVFGALVLLVAFVALIWAILRVGMVAGENFETFICLGVAIMFGVQFLLNAGSATGLTPVVGVTFPFMSYGGSSMLANSFLLALVNAIRRRS